MTEEKRTFENNGIKLVEKFGTYVFAEEICSLPVPINKKELIHFVYKDLEMENQAAMVIQMIGIDEFWDRYGKPVSKKMWYVKVPHLKDVYYCICCTEGEEDTLRTCDPYIVDTYPIDVCEVSFTESEIKKYHLEDCEKVLVDGSSK